MPPRVAQRDLVLYLL